MKKILPFLLILSLLCGCALFRNPKKSWDKAVNNAAQVEKQIANNKDETVRKGAGYVFASKLVLEADPSTNRFHEVGVVLNDKALLTLGPPNMEEENALRVMVANLLSTNRAVILKGEKQLAAVDAKVIALQQQNEVLKDKLEKAEKKIIETGNNNAEFASKWTKLVKIFWYFIYFIIAGFVIKLLAAIAPPPYNSIIGLVSFPLGLIIKGIKAFVPESIHAAGVVATQTYDNTQLTLKHVIKSIEEHKRTNPEESEKLFSILKDITSREVTRPVIEATRKELGY